jgi:hypothetical protein
VAVGGLGGVSPQKIKAKQPYSATREALDARSHNRKAGGASAAIERSLGRGGHSTDAGGSQEINCEATLFSAARKRLLCWQLHPFHLD